MRVRLAALDVDDEADAAGVVLVARVVEAERRCGSHGVDTTYALARHRSKMLLSNKTDN